MLVDVEIIWWNEATSNCLGTIAPAVRHTVYVSYVVVTVSDQLHSRRSAKGIVVAFLGKEVWKDLHNNPRYQPDNI